MAKTENSSKPSSEKTSASSSSSKPAASSKPASSSVSSTKPEKTSSSTSPKPKTSTATTSLSSSGGTTSNKTSGTKDAAKPRIGASPSPAPTKNTAGGAPPTARFRAGAQFEPPTSTPAQMQDNRIVLPPDLYDFLQGPYLRSRTDPVVGDPRSGKLDLNHFLDLQSPAIGPTRRGKHGGIDEFPIITDSNYIRAQEAMNTWPTGPERRYSRGGSGQPRLTAGLPGMVDPISLPGGGVQVAEGPNGDLIWEDATVGDPSEYDPKAPWKGMPGENMGTPSATTLTAAELDAKGVPKPTVWDNVVDGAGQLLEHTTLGGIVKHLFPDMWYGGGEMVKGIDDGGRAYTGVDPQMLSGGGDSYGSEGTGGTGGPMAPPSEVPSFPDVNHNGIDDRLEGLIPGFGARHAVFPGMPPYNPGVDNEWLYFRPGMADGGIVGYAEGGPVSPLAEQDPRVAVIAAAEDAIEDIVAGGKPDEEETAALKKFVEMFGDGALKLLHDNVKAGMKMNQKGGKGGRAIEGPGGPKDDAIPAVLDNGQPTALSDGEFVMSADAVAGAGGPEAMQELHDRLASMKAAA